MTQTLSGQLTQEQPSVGKIHSDLVGTGITLLRSPVTILDVSEYETTEAVWDRPAN